MSTQWHFDPESYLAMVRSEIADYDGLQARVAELTRDVPATRVLDLGSGTGVTAARLRAVHPGAHLIGVDSSVAMLEHARALVPDAEFVVADLGDALPPGPFDVVVSAFAVHHLDAPAKAELFERVAAVLTPAGRFVLCDVVVPTGPVEHAVPLDDEIDRPSPLADQIEWLERAGLRVTVAVERGDVAIVVGVRPSAAR